MPKEKYEEFEDLI
jgi:hypothetical protein